MKNIITDERYLAKKIRENQKRTELISDKDFNFDSYDIEEVQLPEFTREKDGSFKLSEGMVTVVTLEDLKEYKKQYSDLYEIIKKTCKKEIARIYKNALNTLISKSNIGKTSRLLTDMLNGKTLNEGQIFFGFVGSDNDKTIGNLQHIVSIVSNTIGVAEERRFKPSKIYELLGDQSQKSDTLEYILPVFTDKGIKSNIVNGQFLMDMRAVSKDEVEALRSYMLEQAGDDIALVKFVEEYFKVSNRFAKSIINGNSEDCIYNLRVLTGMSTEIFGDDPTEFLKKKRINTPFNVEGTSDQEEDYFSRDTEGLSESDFTTQLVNEKDVYQSKITSINMNTSYKTNVVNDNGNMVIALTAPNGGEFIIKIENGKLGVYEPIEEEPISSGPEK